MFAKHLALLALVAAGAACSGKPQLDCSKSCHTVADCDVNYACSDRVCVPESGGFDVSSCPGHSSSSAASSSSASSSTSTSSSSSASSASASSSSGTTGRAVCQICLTATDCASGFCPDDGLRPLRCQPRLCRTDNSCPGYSCITDTASARVGRCECVPSSSTSGSTGSTGSSGSQGSTGTGSTGTGSTT